MEEGAASTEEKRRRFTVRPEAPDAPPVPSLFRPSAASGPPGGAPAPALPGPPSYAEYVMRQAAAGEAGAPAGEAKAPAGEARAPMGEARAPTGEAKAPTGEAKAPTSKAKAPTGEAKAPTGEAKAPTGEAKAPTGEARAPTGEAKAPTGPPPGTGSGGNGAGDVAPLPPLKPGAKSSSIIVSPRQRGNPLLRFVRNVPWEFGDVVPDYVLGQSTCALFLSLRYHNLNPDYIHERLRRLGRSYALQLLLLQVDVKDPHQALKELAKMCLLADCTLILAWSAEEAGRYLETYKAYEQKPADLLKERVEQGFLSRMTDCLTSVKSVNKTDTASLLAAFGSLAAIAGASREDLSLCPGIGPQKAKRLFDVLHEPFLKAPK